MEKEYTEQKTTIRNLINEFDLTDNLFKLADALALVKKVLKINQFPVKKYEEWKKVQ